MLLSEDAALSEAKILHPGSSGYFVICAKDPHSAKGWRQSALPMRDLDSAIAAVKQTPHDRYISQSSFIVPNRQAINFQSIRAAYVDLDCEQNLGVVPDSYFVERVLATTLEMGIPTPSVVICSGRGLYCKWYFKHEVTADDMIRWKTLNLALLKMFSSLGADPKVRDLARVLRVIGSINTKVKSNLSDVVRVEHDSGELHDFSQLCKSVSIALVKHHQAHNPSSRLMGLLDGDLCAKLNPASRKVLQAVDLLQDQGSTNIAGLQNYTDLRRPIMICDKATGAPTSRYERDVGLNWRRFIDLRNLIVMRGGAPKGTRDQFVFWMLNHLAMSGVVTAENFEDEARELIHLFPQHDGFDPLTEGHLNTLAKKVKLAAAGSTVEFGGRTLSHLYTPKTSELVDAFEITEEEQKSMSTLFLHKEKLRRQDEKAPGRSERRKSRNERVEVIAALPSVAVAVEALPLSERQIRRVRERLKKAEKAASLYSDGLKWADIAQRMGLTERQVKGLIKLAKERSAQSPVARPASAKNIKAEHAVRLRDCGLKTADIAAQMGLSERQVRRLFSVASTSCAGDDVPPKFSEESGLQKAVGSKCEPVGQDGLEQKIEAPSLDQIPDAYCADQGFTAPEDDSETPYLNPMDFFMGLESADAEREMEQEQSDSGNLESCSIKTMNQHGRMEEQSVAEYLKQISKRIPFRKNPPDS